MKIKSLLSSYLAPVRRAIIKQKVPNTGKDAGTRNLYAAVRIETGTATMEISMEIVQKIKNGNTTQPSRITRVHT